MRRWECRIEFFFLRYEKNNIRKIRYANEYKTSNRFVYFLRLATWGIVLGGCVVFMAEQVIWQLRAVLYRVISLVIWQPMALLYLAVAWSSSPNVIWQLGAVLYMVNLPWGIGLGGCVVFLTEQVIWQNSTNLYLVDVRSHGLHDRFDDQSCNPGVLYFGSHILMKCSCFLRS